MNQEKTKISRGKKTMNKNRKLLAIILTVILATSMLAGITASASENTGSIEINVPDGRSLSLVEQGLRAYRIFDVKTNEDGTRFAYTVLPAFETFIVTVAGHEGKSLGGICIIWLKPMKMSIFLQK